MSALALSCLPPPGTRFFAPPALDSLFQQPQGPELVRQSVSARPARYEVSLPEAPTHILVVSLRVEGAVVDGRLAGQAQRFVRRAGQNMLLPAGADSFWTTAPAMHEALCFGFPSAWLRTTGEAHGLPHRAEGLAPRVAHRDPVLARLAAHAHRLDLEGGASPEAFEHIAVMAALRLLGEAATAETPVGALAPRRLRRVLEHIEAQLEETLRLEDLAATAGLSMFHFARAFRQSVGVPPHAYIRNRRVARAQEMLRDGQSALADIALACGFADQSHFTTAFRKATGTTPRRWRAARH